MKNSFYWPRLHKSILLLKREYNWLVMSEGAVLLKRLAERIEDDLLAAAGVIYYAEDRIFNDASLPASEKILSLSDETAAFIKKGGRDAVAGYKPQLVRSSNGFVTAIIVEKGNPATS
ncbi:MAG: hypothetical protein GXP32_06135 [Kiritimatiellaeota bacterium]|nr:hypothetical protein [Kiritimatiellota bacterium]